MSKLNLIGVSSNGTRVFEHPEAHPHRMDLAAEAIAKMVIPERPADPTDRNQTRAAATVDLNRKIGVNHLVETDECDTIVWFDRGRGYKSRMALKEAEDETKLTSVCFWDTDTDCWVLWTNFEGEEGLPEPGCDRYNKASEEFKAKCDEFWATHALVPTEDEKIDILRKEDVDIEDIEEGVEKEYWEVVVESNVDLGPCGGYPETIYFDDERKNNKQEAIDFAVKCLAKGTTVESVSAIW